MSSGDLDDAPMAPVHAVDATGQVWGHPNPIELYRFIRARNQLLATIPPTPR